MALSRRDEIGCEPYQQGLVSWSRFAGWNPGPLALFCMYDGETWALGSDGGEGRVWMLFWGNGDCERRGR